MTSTEKDMSNAKNAFDNVVKIYKETSFFLKDISTNLNERNFVATSGNIENYGGYSRSLDWTSCWLLRCAELRFKYKEDNSRLISFTISFLTGPNLIVGVLENMYDIGLLYELWCNENKEYKYSHQEKEINYSLENKDTDGKVIDFIFREDDKKKGFFFAKPLLSIKNYDDVKSLSEKVVDLWEDKYGPIK